VAYLTFSYEESKFAIISIAYKMNHQILIN